MLVFTPVFVNAQVSAGSLLEQIEALKAQISILQNQVLESQNKSTEKIGQEISGIAKTFVSFAKDLSVGDKGGSVTDLQKALKQEGVYSGPITGYFGPLTKGGVARFQDKYAGDVLKPLNLTVGTGYFGLSTRKKLNALLVNIQTDIQITFAMDGTTKEIVAAQGSPLTLVWDVANTSSFYLTPCTASVDAVNNEGNIVALTDYYYSWIGSQPAKGSAEVLAYADSGPADQLKRIFKFTCNTLDGIKTSSVSVKVTDTEPNTANEKMVITLLANGVSGKSTAKFSIAGINELKLSWSAVGDANPTMCTLSDFGNVVIAKNLTSSDSYTVKNPKAGERYYINCTDGDGEYAFDGVELTE